VLNPFFFLNPSAGNCNTWAGGEIPYTKLPHRGLPLTSLDKSCSKQLFPHAGLRTGNRLAILRSREIPSEGPSGLVA